MNHYAGFSLLLASISLSLTLKHNTGEEAHFDFYISGKFVVLPLPQDGTKEIGDNLRCMDGKRDLRWRENDWRISEDEQGREGKVFVRECRGQVLYYGTMADLLDGLYAEVRRDRFLYRIIARRFVLVYMPKDQSREGEVRLDMDRTVKINCGNMTIYGEQVSVNTAATAEIIVSGDLIVQGTQKVDELRFGYLTVGNNFMLLRNAVPDKVETERFEVQSNNAYIEGAVYVIGFDERLVDFKGEWKTKTGEVNVKGSLDTVPKYMADNIKQIRQSSKTSHIKFSDKPDEVHTFYGNVDSDSDSDDKREII